MSNYREYIRKLSSLIDLCNHMVVELDCMVENEFGLREPFLSTVRDIISGKLKLFSATDLDRLLQNAMDTHAQRAEKRSRARCHECSRPIPCEKELIVDDNSNVFCSWSCFDLKARRRSRTVQPGDHEYNKIISRLIKENSK